MRTVSIYVALGNKGRQNVLECSLKDLCKFSSHGAMLHGIGWYAFSLSHIVQKFTMKYSYIVRNPIVKDFSKKSRYIPERIRRESSIPLYVLF